MSTTTSPTTDIPTTVALGKFVNRPLVALLIVTLFAGTLAYQPPLAVDLGSPGIVLNGFYDLEGRSSGQPYRWTSASAHIWLGGIGRQPYRLMLRLSSARPNALPLPTIRVFANDVLLDTFEVPRPIRDFELSIPDRAVGTSGDVDLRIDSDTFAPPNDLRALGVTLYAMRLETAPGQPPFTWPALSPLAWGMLSLAFFFLALGARLPGRVVWPVTIILLFLFCAGLALQRTLAVEALPYAVLASVIAYVAAMTIGHAPNEEEAA
jgi:hypothetical protein